MAKKQAKAKQGHLKDMEPVSIQEIDDAADAYVEARNERMSLTEEEVEKHAALLELMRKHELTTYTTPDGFVATISSTSKVKVRKPREDNSDEE